MKSPIFFFLLLAIFFFTACPSKPEDPKYGTLELNFQLKANGSDGKIGEKYQMATNRFLKIDSMRFYVSDVRAVKEDGSELYLKDVVLFDFSKAAQKTVETTHGLGVYQSFQVPIGKYKGIRFRLGLPNSVNHSDANAYDLDNALNAARGMHWNLTDGYVFVQIAGFSDSLTTGNYVTPVSYQIGLDALAKDKDYSTSTSHSFSISTGNETQFILQTELTEILNGTDIVRQPITQSRPQGSVQFTQAQKIMENFATNSFYKVP